MLSYAVRFLWSETCQTMRLFLGFAVRIFVVVHAVAQDPTIDRAETTGLRPGESAEVRVHGTNLKSLQTMWTTFGELKPAPPGENPNDKLAVFTGPVPAATVPGIYPYRVVAANGCSSTHFFVVDDLPNVGFKATSMRSNLATLARSLELVRSCL